MVARSLPYSQLKLHDYLALLSVCPSGCEQQRLTLTFKPGVPAANSRCTWVNTAACELASCTHSAWQHSDTPMAAQLYQMTSVYSAWNLVPTLLVCCTIWTYWSDTTTSQPSTLLCRLLQYHSCSLHNTTHHLIRHLGWITPSG